MSEATQRTRQMGEGGFKGKKNIYMCHTCGHGFVSQDVDEGVTPFATPCRHPGCGGMASSFMYMAPQEVLERIPPAVEWYKPSVVEMLSQAAREHVDRGGLISRPARRRSEAAG